MWAQEGWATHVPDTCSFGGFTCISRFILTMDPESCYSLGTCQDHLASLHQCLAPFRFFSTTLLSSSPEQAENSPGPCGPALPR